MTSKLALYNGALRHCGERRLASLTENREPRRYLDEAWNDDFIKKLLEAGYWKFALRTTKLEIDPAVVVEFGYRNGFAKPTDMVQIAQISADEYFNTPLLGYTEEQDWLFSDVDIIYLQYVSIDDNYGSDLTKWTGAFSDFAEADLAVRIIRRLTQKDGDEAWNKMFKLRRRLLTTAKSLDAMAGPTKFMPEGSWVSARRGGGGGRGDGGNRGSLIG